MSRERFARLLTGAAALGFGLLMGLGFLTWACAAAWPARRKS